MKESELSQVAIDIRKNAYSPYSGFRVGAAVLCKSGKVYTGVNIENVSYGATVCAERTALFKAVSEGELEFLAISIGSDSEDYIYPCGVCRQVLAEFGKEDMKIICTKKDGQYKVYTLGELLPNAFVEFEKNK